MEPPSTPVRRGERQTADAVTSGHGDGERGGDVGAGVGRQHVDRVRPRLGPVWDPLIVAVPSAPIAETAASSVTVPSPHCTRAE